MAAEMSGRRQCASPGDAAPQALRVRPDASNSPFGELSSAWPPAPPTSSKSARAMPTARSRRSSPPPPASSPRTASAAPGSRRSPSAPASTRSSSTTTSTARTSCSSPSSSGPTPTSARPSARCTSRPPIRCRRSRAWWSSPGSHYLAHPEFLALLNSENMLGAGHLKRSPRIRQMNSPLIEGLAEVLRRGEKSGVLRGGVDAMQLYISIAGLAYFYLSNQHTLGTIFGRDLMQRRRARRAPRAHDRGRHPLRAGLSRMDAIDRGFYRHQGHLTVNGVFAAAEMDAVVRDIERWGEAFLAELPAEQRAWYLDGGVKARTVLRKLDNPHAAPARGAGAGARPPPRRPRRSAARPRRLGLLQPDLLQAAGGRRAQAGAPGQLLLRPDRHRRRRHRLDRARRRDARERLPLLRRRHEPRPGLPPLRARRRAVQPAACRPRCSTSSR